MALDDEKESYLNMGYYFYPSTCVFLLFYIELLNSYSYYFLRRLVLFFLLLKSNCLFFIFYSLYLWLYVCRSSLGFIILGINVLRFLLIDFSGLMIDLRGFYFLLSSKYLSIIFFI